MLITKNTFDNFPYYRQNVIGILRENVSRRSRKKNPFVGELKAIWSLERLTRLCNPFHKFKPAKSDNVWVINTSQVVLLLWNLLPHKTDCNFFLKVFISSHLERGHYYSTNLTWVLQRQICRATDSYQLILLVQPVTGPRGPYFSRISSPLFARFFKRELEAKNKFFPTFLPFSVRIRLPVYFKNSARAIFFFP